MTLEDLGTKMHKATLSSGAQLVHFERAGAPLHLRASFISGSRFDPPEKEGLAHFAEHMLLTSTEKYPTQEKFTNFIAGYGGQFNAFTGPEEMSVHVSLGDPEDVEVGAEFLSQALLHGLLNKADMENERGAILDELRRSLSTPQRMLMLLWRRLYFQGTMLDAQFSNLGSEESIGSITREDISHYCSNMLTSNRALFWSCGGLGIERVSGLIEGLQLPKGSDWELPEDKPTRNVPLMIERFEGKEQIYLSFGFQATPYGHTDEYAVGMIRAILGTASGSLFRKLRLERGLVYGVSMSQRAYAQAGNITIETSSSKKNLKEVLSIIAAECRRVYEGKLSQDELDFAKKKMMKALRLSLQSSEAWVNAHDSSFAVWKGRFPTVVEELEKMQSVTLEDTRRAGKAYFAPGQWYLGMTGDITEDEVAVEY